MLLKKVGLALAIALLVCLLPMPFGYYTLVRFASMIIFGCMSYDYYVSKRLPLCVLAGALALLFQPVFPIELDRMTWNVVDVVVAVWLIVMWNKGRKTENTDEEKDTQM